MSVRKRNWTTPNGERKTAWQVDYRDQNGKRRSKQFRTKKEADEYADRARTEVRQGVHTHDRDSITVKDAAKLRIAAAEAEDLERSTIKRYKELHRLYIVATFGGTKLSALTKVQIENYRDELLRTVSRAMTLKIIREFSAILNNGLRIGALVGQNVARGVKIPDDARGKEEIEPPSRTDLKKMIGAASDDERPLILTAILTGLRSSELRGLRWKDVDFDAATISVRQRADQWGVIGPPKSKSGRRTIPIPGELVRELKRWKLRSPPSAAGLAFPSSTGTPLRHNNLVRRMYNPLQLRAGLTELKLGEDGEPIIDGKGNLVLTGRYGFHELRHAAASAWIASKVDLKRLQVWIGHKSIALTLNTYGHLLKDAELDAQLATDASRDLFA